MRGEIDKCSVIGVNNSLTGESSDVPRLAAMTPRVASLTGSAFANPEVERLARLPRKITEEEDQWSPTLQEVDAYIDSLERELSQSGEDMPERTGKICKGAAAIKDRLSSFDTFFWGMVAMTAGCFWGLARIILRALN